MSSIYLIPSASYCENELIAEYGKLPPTFLPVGHRRLYEAQASLFKNLGRIVITLPADFDFSFYDQSYFEDNQIDVIKVPTGLSLGQSISYAIDVINLSDQCLHILHGDTLIYDIDYSATDLFTISTSIANYSWGSINSNEPDKNVFSGYFSIGDIGVFKKNLALSQYNFIDAIQRYCILINPLYVKANNWLDFGHLQTFYKSRCSVRTTRHFNEIDITFKSIKKRSSNSKKIIAEARWFSDIPRQLNAYTPALLSANSSELGAEYELEYLPIPSLHELLVFGKLPIEVWQLILSSCMQFIGECKAVGHANAKKYFHCENPIKYLTYEKTKNRLIDLANNFNLDKSWVYQGKLVPPIKEIVENLLLKINYRTNSHLSVMHGDLCFSNVFFDYRMEKVRVIDPRGSIQDEPTIFGDARYDLAKLAHSIIGGYDLILANRFDCSDLNDENLFIRFHDENLPLQAVFKEYIGNDTEIISIMINLFLSMIPLHEDRKDRQNAFFINSLRLYSEYFL